MAVSLLHRYIIWSIAQVCQLGKPEKNKGSESMAIVKIFKKEPSGKPLKKSWSKTNE